MNEAETLCDRIVLIDRGRRLLYGPVDEIRRSFSDGAVVVRGRDIPVEAARYRSASDVRAEHGSVRFLLREGAAASDLFREIAATEAAVETFEVATPSLAEIFIRAVQGDARVEAMA
jgi:ABC-2 type transport system ATP-binding protein